MKSIAMHITNQKLSFYIFIVENLLNILMIFGIKEKIYNFDQYNVMLAIATNIPVQLKTGFCGPGSHI